MLPIKEAQSISDNFIFSKIEPIQNVKINIIGKTVEEALIEIEKFIDNALLNNVSKIEIIHGKGRGKLKKAVREYLKDSNFVLKFYSPMDLHGGEGITIVELK